MSLKIIKIKNIPNASEIILWLVTLLKESENHYNPLIEEINLPSKDFFILKDCDIIMPAYILCKEDEALVLWVHKSCRKRGYAKFMINSMNIRYAIAAPESIVFWEKIGFKKLDSNLSSGPIRFRRY